MERIRNGDCTDRFERFMEPSKGPVEKDEIRKALVGFSDNNIYQTVYNSEPITVWDSKSLILIDLLSSEQIELLQENYTQIKTSSVTKMKCFI